MLKVVRAEPHWNGNKPISFLLGYTHLIQYNILHNNDCRFLGLLMVDFKKSHKIFNTIITMTDYLDSNVIPLAYHVERDYVFCIQRVFVLPLLYMV